jgi:hypothetical protein
VTPKTLVSWVFRMSSAVTSPTGFPAPAIPALLIRTSRPPASWRMISAAAFTESSSVGARSRGPGPCSLGPRCSGTRPGSAAVSATSCGATSPDCPTGSPTPPRSAPGSSGGRRRPQSGDRPLSRRRRAAVPDHGPAPRRHRVRGAVGDRDRGPPRDGHQDRRPPGRRNAHPRLRRAHRARHRSAGRRLHRGSRQRRDELGLLGVIGTETMTTG